jgi:hypothetical protein
MSDFHADYKEQLLTAAEALFGSPAERSVHKMRRRGRVPFPALVALGALLLAGTAFAASQIIGVGAPVTVTHEQGQPSVSTGVGIPVHGATSSHPSGQLPAVSAPDPPGGLPWGMRIVRTTRGLVCVQVGRLLNGRLGVLGQDGQSNNDGLFPRTPGRSSGPRHV